jgi:hypothetical protein
MRAIQKPLDLDSLSFCRFALDTKGVGEAVFDDSDFADAAAGPIRGNCSKRFLSLRPGARPFPFRGISTGHPCERNGSLGAQSEQAQVAPFALARMDPARGNLLETPPRPAHG